MFQVQSSKIIAGKRTKSPINSNLSHDTTLRYSLISKFNFSKKVEASENSGQSSDVDY